MDCPSIDDPAQLIFYPSTVRCDWYYLCSKGTPVKFVCAPDFHWNQKKLLCDFPENAKCTVNEAEIECPPNSETVIFHPSELHCDWYYICVNGKPIQQSCAPGLHWNQKIHKCVIPENANCQIF